MYNMYIIQCIVNRLRLSSDVLNKSITYLLSRSMLTGVGFGWRMGVNLKKNCSGRRAE